MKDLKLEKLNKLLHLVSKRSKFYQAKYKNVKSIKTGHVITWEDFFSLPLTSRTEIAMDQLKNPPFGTNLTKDIKKYVYLNHTSGTSTGRPLFLPSTATEFDQWANICAEGYKLLGLKRGDIICHLTTTPSFALMQAATRKLGVTYLPAEGHKLVELLNNLKHAHVTILQTFPTAFIELTELAEELSINLKKLRLRKLITVGEPTGNDSSFRNYLKKKWGVDVVDHIGSMESAMLATMCLKTGDYHLLDRFIIPEVIDPVTLVPAKKGELILTFLWREGYPLIRYRTGEIVEIANGRCDCGLASPRLVGGILGRIDGRIKVGARYIYPAEVEKILRSHSMIGEFEVVFKNVSGRDGVDVFVEIPASFGYEYMKSISIKLQTKFEIIPKIYPLLPKTLPRLGFRKAKRFHDTRDGLTYKHPPKRIFLSKMYLELLIIKRMKDRLIAILAIFFKGLSK